MGFCHRKFGPICQVPEADGHARQRVDLVAGAAVLQVPAGEGRDRGRAAIGHQAHVGALPVPVPAALLPGQLALEAEGVLILDRVRADVPGRHRHAGVDDVLVDHLERLAHARLAGPEGAALDAERPHVRLQVQRGLARGAHRDGHRAGDLRLLGEVLLEEGRPLGAGRLAGVLDEAPPGWRPTTAADRRRPSARSASACRRARRPITSPL